MYNLSWPGYKSLNMTFIDLIIDANLYSLQAIAMYSLFSYNLTQFVCKHGWLLRSLWMENKIINDKMMLILKDIWNIYASFTHQYFSCFDNNNTVNLLRYDMFPLLLSSEYFNEQYLSSTKLSF